MTESETKWIVRINSFMLGMLAGELLALFILR